MAKILGDIFQVENKRQAHCNAPNSGMEATNLLLYINSLVRFFGDKWGRKPPLFSLKIIS